MALCTAAGRPGLPFRSTGPGSGFPLVRAAIFPRADGVTGAAIILRIDFVLTVAVGFNGAGQSEIDKADRICGKGD